MDDKGERVEGKPIKKNTRKTNEKRRGRPKLAEGERGTYEAVLLPKSITGKVDLLNERNRSIDKKLLYTYVDSFDEYEEVREYYWKLTLSYAIYQFIHILQEADENSSPKLRAAQIADLLKINTFNLKRLSSGKGQTASFVKLIDSLYRQGVNVLEVKYMPGIVLMAYAKYIQASSGD